MAELKRRLVGRGTETEEKIRQRLEKAKEVELGRAAMYDFLIVNDDVETCTKELNRLIKTGKGIRPEESELLPALEKESDL